MGNDSIVELAARAPLEALARRFDELTKQDEERKELTRVSSTRSMGS